MYLYTITVYLIPNYILQRFIMYSLFYRNNSNFGSTGHK